MASIGSQFMCQDFAECIASVQAAEEAGYSHAWFIDSQILWQDCVVYMTSSLAATKRIVVGTAVTNPFTRHVTTTASTFATLAQLHPGRLELGIGRGDSAVRTMGLEPGQDGVPARLDPGAARPGRRPPRGAERRRRPLPLGRGGSEGADHDVRDRAEEPPGRRLARRPRHALRRRQRDVGALGDGARPRGRRGGRARPRRGSASRS